MVSNNSNNSIHVPEVKKMEHENANEIGITLKNGYNGDITSKNAGAMVKKMIEAQEQQMSERQP